jgi:hypothetical protein
MSHKALKRKRDENDTMVTLGTGTAATFSSRPGVADEEKYVTRNTPAIVPRSSKMEEVNEAIGYMDGGLLADHFAKQSVPFASWKQWLFLRSF